MAEGGTQKVAERWHGWRVLGYVIYREWIQGLKNRRGVRWGQLDLTTVDRAVLIAIIAELQAVIERLQRRIDALLHYLRRLPGETGRPAPNARPQAA